MRRDLLRGLQPAGRPAARETTRREGVLGGSHGGRRQGQRRAWASWQKQTVENALIVRLRCDRAKFVPAHRRPAVPFFEGVTALLLCILPKSSLHIFLGRMAIQEETGEGAILEESPKRTGPQFAVTADVGPTIFHL